MNELFIIRPRQWRVYEVGFSSQADAAKVATRLLGTEDVLIQGVAVCGCDVDTYIRTSLKAQAIAKLTPAEREALGV